MAALPAAPVADAGAVTQNPRGSAKPGGGTQPSGGIPEPATLLLVVGGAIGYGAYRMKQARKEASKER